MLYHNNQMVLGIDMGNYNMKTANVCFPSAYMELAGDGNDFEYPKTSFPVCESSPDDPSGKAAAVFYGLCASARGRRLPGAENLDETGIIFRQTRFLRRNQGDCDGKRGDDPAYLGAPGTEEEKQGEIIEAEGEFHASQSASSFQCLQHPASGSC